jgi:hypothetical protein
MVSNWPEPYAAWDERIANEKHKPAIAPDFLFTETTYLLCGQPRAGKSAFAVDLAVGCATGTPITGSIPVTEPVNVLYCTEEDAEQFVRARIGGCLRARGITMKPATLYMSVWRGVSFDDEKNGAEWRATIAHVVKESDIRVVVFDPLINFTTKVGTNAAEFQPKNLFLRGLALDGNCAVVVVHHEAKTPFTESRAPAQRASGGGVFAAMDCPISFKALSNTAFVATPDQWKHAATPPPFGLTLTVEPDVYRLVATRAPESATTAKASRVERIIAFVNETPGESKTAIKQAVGGYAGTFNRDYVLALNSGRIVESDRKIYPVKADEAVAA